MSTACCCGESAVFVLPFSTGNVFKDKRELMLILASVAAFIGMIWLQLFKTQMQVTAMIFIGGVFTTATGAIGAITCDMAKACCPPP